MGFFDKIKAKVTSVFEAVGFDKLVSGLEKTRAAFVNRLQKVLGGGRKIDAQLLDEVEEILITSDIGVTTSAKIIENVKATVKKERFENAEQIYDLIKQEILAIFAKAQQQWTPLDYNLTGKS
ncbi:MAG TPA: signal recognition particle receptor subunit alpha, partial [Candidatus Kapabacteria bacterium]|nr:signal recognition particle receptor subunit alpha [Candidatus Kapabacteria bacterium]